MLEHLSLYDCTGGAKMGSAMSATAIGGADYSSNGGGYFAATASTTATAPYFTNNAAPNDIHVTSASASLTLSGTWNFEIQACFTGINVNLQSSSVLSTGVSYKYGTNSYTVIAGLGGSRRRLSTIEPRFAAGDTVTVDVKYAEFKPNETTVLYYSIAFDDGAEFQVMKKVVTVPLSGTDLVHVDWTIPWSFLFARNETTRAHINVRLSNDVSCYTELIVFCPYLTKLPILVIFFP